jgi:N-acetyl-gamma-glutamyl-phosphate reductase
MSEGVHRIRVGIVGGTGYTGVELLRLLAHHPGVEISCITSRGEAGTRVDRFFPSLRGAVELEFLAPEDAPLDRCNVVFFATPHGVAMRQARGLLDAGVKVIDLAADFRLRDPARFEAWYGMPHADPALLAEAVYGLPEIDREAIRAARLIAIPGCYPTSIQLGLAPVLELERASPGQVDCTCIIADAKSGVSGAGRKAELGLLSAEVSENFRAYGLAGHRHHPETEQQLARISGRPVGLSFVPHLVPMIRGIFSTIYVRMTGARFEAMQALYERRYRGEPFVDVLPAGSAPETRSVRGTNLARIALANPAPGLLAVLVVEDNLVKGAAGQAVQCMNLACGLPETAGLTQLAVVP